MTPAPLQPQTPHVPVSQSAMVMGTLLDAGIGSGKTTLLGEHGLQHLQKGLPQVLFDPLGTLTPNLLFRLVSSLQHVPPKLHSRFWERVRYVDVGSKDAITPFPIYYRTGAESLREVAERFIDTLRLAHPRLVTQASVTFPNLRRVGINTGMVLASLGYQLTEAEDLLFNTFAWERSGRFAEVLKRDPEAAPAMSYFREQYLPLSRSEKHRLTSAFLDHVFPFSHDPKLRLLFGARTPGINWEDVEERGQTVILDFKHVTDPEARRFAMLWIFSNLYEHIKRRGRRSVPFVVTIDEFASFTQQVSDAVNPLAVLLNEFIQQFMRNHTIWFTCAFQSLNQIDDQLRNTVLSLGNYVIGRAATMQEARDLADVLYKQNPFKVKHYRNVWMSGGSLYGKPLPPFVVDREPQFMQLSEQRELTAQKIARLGLFEFLLRPALREGAVSQTVYPISIASAVRDEATGELVFPDEGMVARLRAGLAARSGIPVNTILKEQEQRVLPNPAAPRRMPVGGQPAPQEAKVYPLLDEYQQAFLRFLIANPDTPVSAIYKGIGVGAGTGALLRDSLKAHGFLVEFEIRTGSAGAGRPMKCLMPTFAAFEVLGKEPPAGRGGMLHRYMQHLAEVGATAKGYSVHCEKELGNGAIVDVHLKNGQVRIAVEIAVVSKPGREVAHIKHCLSFGYDQVVTLFADEYLLARTKQEMQEIFSREEAGKVRLLPFRQLARIG
jgi:hypothetical protein